MLRKAVFRAHLACGVTAGLVTQTVAGVVSLTSTIMVWTGLALAWRRLIRPLFGRRSLHSQNGRLSASRPVLK